MLRAPPQRWPRDLRDQKSPLDSHLDPAALSDARWMEISSLLRRELAAGRSPEQIKQIEFVGETMDMASHQPSGGGWRQ